MQLVPIAMEAQVNNPPWAGAPAGVRVTYNTPVVAMTDNGDDITVTFADGSFKQYSAVFNTTTMGCLGRMDLSGLKLPLGESLDQDPITAIRTLAYDRATKVAIKFDKPWWTTSTPAIINGGVSSTDLPISNVIYPSWNDPDMPNVIIVSYSWAQDATRMASLVTDLTSADPHEPDVNDRIVQLCFEDLSLLWRDHDPSITPKFLQDSYVNHHAWAWSHDPWTAGAFALFAPGQFKNLYTQFTKPMCGGKLMICGEAISAHHAWISGALDSAYNAVLAWAIKNKYAKYEDVIKNSPFGGGSGSDTQEWVEKVFYWHVKTPELGQRERS